MAEARRRLTPVIAGHFGFAALVKAREPQVPLWSLMLATVWLDIVFVPLFLLGIETIDAVPDTAGGYGNGIIHADYTHSLTGALVLSALFGLVFAKRWGRRCAVVLAAVVFSHWLLDLMVHRTDLPLLPANLGALPRLGFGLWRHPRITIAVELALVLAGAGFYRLAAGHAIASANGRPGMANLTTGLIALGGLAVLLLDVVG